jgi:hypothetical protein
MKFFALLLLVLALSKQILSQQSFDLPHCKCVDEIQRSTPILDGKYTRTCRGKLIESGAFSNGEKDGEWTTYNPKGKIIRKLKYQKGKIDGPVDLFYADGTPKLTASCLTAHQMANGHIILQKVKNGLMEVIIKGYRWVNGPSGIEKGITSFCNTITPLIYT